MVPPINISWISNICKFMFPYQKWRKRQNYYSDCPNVVWKVRLCSDYWAVRQRSDKELCPGNSFQQSHTLKWHHYWCVNMGTCILQCCILHEGTVLSCIVYHCIIITLYCPEFYSVTLYCIVLYCIGVNLFCMMFS